MCSVFVLGVWTTETARNGANYSSGGTRSAKRETTRLGSELVSPNQRCLGHVGKRVRPNAIL